MLSLRGPGALAALYRDLLGGVVVYQFPPEGEPGFVSLDVGDSHIGLGRWRRRARSTAARSGPRPATGSSSASTSTTWTQTYAAAAEQGLEQVKPPEDMPWGERTAWIADPDGNLLMLTR